MNIFLQFIFRFKKTMAFVTILLIGGGVFWMRSGGSAEPVRYQMGVVSQGTVISTISGSGQVSSEREIEIKPEDASGKVVMVFVKQGQEVKSGDQIVSIDQSEALKTLRNAERSVQDANNGLKAAQLSLQQVKEPADATGLLKAENALNAAKRSLEDLKDGSDPLDISQAESQVSIQERKTRISEDGVTPEIVREAYDQTIVDLRAVAQTLNSALDTVDSILGIDRISANLTYQQYLGVRSAGTLELAKSQYSIAKNSTDALKKKTDALRAVTSTKEEIEVAIALVQSAVNQGDLLLQTMQRVMDYSVTSATFSQSTLDSIRNSINTARTSISGKIASAAELQRSLTNARVSYQDALVSLQSAKTSLEKLQKGSDMSEIASAEEKVKEAQAAYDDLKKGADAYEIASAEQSVAQKRSALASAIDDLNEAKLKLADYTVKAPFDGVIAALGVGVGDEVSPSVSAATLITKVKIATLTLNEVDIVKVKQGQQATLSFDAVEGLTIAGTVAEVDLVGSATQGVVGYGVKIAFTTDDERIKNGMSVSAVIQIAVSTDVVTVQNAAVQTDVSGASYVLVLPAVTQEQVNANPQGVQSASSPERKTVTVGLADETNTEIKTGLSAGDLIVLKTIQPTASKAGAFSSGANGSSGNRTLLQSVGGSTGGGPSSGGGSVMIRELR